MVKESFSSPLFLFYSMVCVDAGMKMRTRLSGSQRHN